MLKHRLDILILLNLLHFYLMINKMILFINKKHLASASYDKSVKIWKMSDYSNVQTLTGHIKYITSVSFSPDGF